MPKLDMLANLGFEKNAQLEYHIVSLSDIALS